MKKVLMLTLSVIFVLSLTGCSDDEASCDQDKGAECATTYTTCLTNAGMDTAKTDACTSAFCSCINDANCSDEAGDQFDKLCKKQ